MTKNIKAYINGEFVDKETRVDVISPITLTACGSYPALLPQEIDKAFHAAKEAFKFWKKTDLKERVSILKLFKKRMLEQKKDMAEIMHQEIGKNVAEAIVEIERTAEYIDKTILGWDEIKLKIEKLNNKTSHQHQIPLGVVLAISPFNYPVNLALSKIAPALLAGNAVVFKAATNGSIVGGMIAQIFDEINIPVGVFNYVTGRGREIGDILTTHKDMDMVSFTGSVHVGKNIAKHIHMKPYVLELGGNDAAYIRHDANLELAIKETIGGAFGYAGQRCTAIKRVIVHEKIAHKFIEALTAKVQELKVNPVVDMKTADYIKELYDDAILKKSKVLVPGHFSQNQIDPILVQVDQSARVWNEEPFGPILPLMVVASDAEAIKVMNDTNFGLQNSIFTEDIAWAQEIALDVESGSVNINGKSSRGPDEFPFLGVKDSGFGTQGIKSALLSMTRTINIVNND